jgi:DNA mismatch endonuclease, patch repair protein
MSDTLTPPERSERMRRVRSRDTRPELIVRRLAYHLGYRYRLQARDLPGRPDLVFRRRRKVIFVHGCFWHRHQDLGCRLARLPKSRPEFWLPKLEGNRQRDERHEKALRDKGWDVLTIWECQLPHRDVLRNRIVAFLDT